MSYKITINNPGNHICNPLLTLDGRKYATREEACEEIYEAMYDVIDGEHGCEMVAKPTVDIAKLIAPLRNVMQSDAMGQFTAWYTYDDIIEVRRGALGENVVKTYKMGELTKRQYWEEVCNGDKRRDDDDTADNLISAIWYDDFIMNGDLEDIQDQLSHDVNANPDPFPLAKKIMSDVLEQINTAIAEVDGYTNKCHNYILEHGHATEDGVDADVEEVADGHLWHCTREGITGDVMDNGPAYTREEAADFTGIELGADDESVHLREATGADDVTGDVDFVAIDGDGNVLGYYRFKPVAVED